MGVFAEDTKGLIKEGRVQTAYDPTDYVRLTSFRTPGLGTQKTRSEAREYVMKLEDFAKTINQGGGPGGGNNVPTKSGKAAPVQFTGALIKEATITFNTPFADADYTPTITIQSPDNYSAVVKNITAGSFVISLNSAIAPTVDVYWTAIKHGEY